MELTQQFINDFELRYLRLIAELLRAHKITLLAAKSSAQLFLTYLPFKDIEDMKHKISNFSEIYRELKPLNTYLLNEIETSETREVLEKMQGLMKNDNIDEALKLAENK